MQLSISITRTDHLAEFDKIFSDEAGLFASTVSDKLLTSAHGYAPVDTGEYQKGLSVFIEAPKPLTITFSIIASAPHSNVVEDGRRPGGKQPPVNVMRAYVRRKGIASDPRMVNAIAFLIGRKIARDGTPAKRPLGRALEANQAFITAEADRMAARIASRL